MLQYAEYGLTHFGTDTVGVNKTRRYLCEALSFQHRYIPIGLLERLPARINERAPAFHGRDELGMFPSLLCNVAGKMPGTDYGMMQKHSLPVQTARIG